MLVCERGKLKKVPDIKYLEVGFNSEGLIATEIICEIGKTGLLTYH